MKFDPRAKSKPNFSIILWTRSLHAEISTSFPITLMPLCERALNNLPEMLNTEREKKKKLAGARLNIECRKSSTRTDFILAAYGFSRILKV